MRAEAGVIQVRLDVAPRPGVGCARGARVVGGLVLKRHPCSPAPLPGWDPLLKELQPSAERAPLGLPHFVHMRSKGGVHSSMLWARVGTYEEHSAAPAAPHASCCAECSRCSLRQRLHYQQHQQQQQGRRGQDGPEEGHAAGLGQLCGAHHVQQTGRVAEGVRGSFLGPLPMRSARRGAQHKPC